MGIQHHHFKMAENFHVAGFVTISITYPHTELSARNSKLVDGKLAEDVEGTMIFHQGWMGAYLRTVKGTVVFKDNVEALESAATEYEDHWNYKAGVGGGVELKPKAKVTGLELGGASVTANAEVGYDNKNNRVIKKTAKRGDRGLTSELGFEAGIPSIGNISCKPHWKRNDLNLKLEKRYDGDCQFHINIMMP